ncbi:hypothetical protein CPB83DRAFT_862837 [Crepidotus variabilis]|uniref:Uncharacterized protein n=1 Tax=Crepidotus variabilis TaxID=179855 RepID=A0A9P6JK22_9AGAR|nr:hypothetical protein CPB83DRAFT_862837 [Crepidotus variabilis]
MVFLFFFLRPFLSFCCLFAPYYIEGYAFLLSFLAITFCFSLPNSQSSPLSF